MPKLTFFKNNPEGVVKIRFNSSKHAELCIEKFDSGLFDGRQLQCFLWDGRTDYKMVKESKEDIEKRVEDFGKWLENN